MGDKRKEKEKEKFKKDELPQLQHQRSEPAVAQEEAGQNFQFPAQVEPWGNWNSKSPSARGIFFLRGRLTCRWDCSGWLMMVLL